MAEEVGEEGDAVTKLDAVVVVDWVFNVEGTVGDVVDGMLVLVNAVLEGKSQCY